MATFKKDCLYVGDWHLPDGRVFSCDGPLRDSLARRARDMLAAGLHIPLAWEHQDDAYPLSEDERRANRARFNLGFLKDAAVAGGALEIVADVPGEDDARRLPSVKFVSPEIRWDWRDGTGRVWEGPSITHVAVTPRPVQHAQQPFRPVELSFDSPPVRLSLDGYTRAVRMADDTDIAVADTDTGDEGFEGLEDEGGEAGMDGAGKLADILAVLSELGLVLPDDTTPSNLLDRLHAAALTMRHHATNGNDTAAGGNGGDQLPGEPSGGAAAQPQMVQPQMPMGMSMTEVHQLKAQLDRANKTLLAKERSDLLSRVAALHRSGRVTREIHDDLSGRLGKVQLSLGKDGGLAPNPVTAEIAAYEKLPAGCVMPAHVQLSDYAREPRMVLDPESEEEKKAVADTIALMTKNVPARNGAK